MTIALRYAARSDVGLLREGNEDSAYASPRLLAVADGMGGHAHGEVASSVAIAAMAALEEDPHQTDLVGAVEGAVRDANRRLHEMVGRDPSLKGMGTTLTAMLWKGTQLALVHVGDSRAYLLRRGELYQITHDHTLVQSLVDDGRITPDEAATHPQRSILLRALDGSGEVDPDLSLREAQVDDRYLLCSDGLTTVVGPETLHQTLTSIDDPEEVVRALIDLANRGGGPDNITCVLADVVDVEEGHTPLGQATFVGAAGSNRLASLSTGGAGTAPGGVAVTMPQPAILDDDEPGRGAQASRRAGRRRRLWPMLTVVLGVGVAVAGIGGFFVYQWTQDQYFVGSQSDEVVVFRGVNTEIGPFQLFDIAHYTGIKVGSLAAFERGQVLDGISVPDVDAGKKKIDELRASAGQASSATSEGQEPEQTPAPPTPKSKSSASPTPSVKRSQ
ncbi:Stp1/IreP family PP2C-type Ser/Thr phosphatase [Sinosporangium siamense]|uniref:Serine/threonine protein phosphatase PstP n=1 Tax=Sinosporangium siamense TaxID=1367973 RepID=A0A919V9Y7_9ACTN|nr:Stp1/IreP family PP2C-type Ser/Thr phosphatase [Sinosporangium siamense]GII95851.1 serine/threonine protein phosphatase [Sinosporangium siamense]